MAFAIDGDLVAGEGLDDEVAHHPAVVDGHAGAIGVEDAGDADIHAVLAVVVHHQGFRHPLAFVVATPGPMQLTLPQ